jgi:hypothetical protein
MTRLMRDSTTLTDVPVAGTQLILVYANGAYFSTPAQVAARFPGIPVVWCDVTGQDPGADVLDVETGDATTATAVIWVKDKLKLKPAYPPIIYCNRGTLTGLFNAMGAAGLTVGEDFHLGISTLDGTKTVADMTGVAFVQYQGDPASGGHYDNSLVYDNAWKVPVAPPKPKPVVPPAPAAAWQAEALVAAEALTAILKANQ